MFAVQNDYIHPGELVHTYNVNSFYFLYIYILRLRIYALSYLCNKETPKLWCSPRYSPLSLQR